QICATATIHPRGSPSREPNCMPARWAAASPIAVSRSLAAWDTCASCRSNVSIGMPAHFGWAKARRKCNASRSRARRLRAEPRITMNRDPFRLLLDGHSEKPAIHLGDFVATRKELAEASDRAAALLAGLGLKRGDVVALWLPDGPAWLQFLFAAASQGIL